MSRNAGDRALAEMADELSQRRRRIRAAGNRGAVPELGLSVDLSGGAAVVEPMTVDKLRETVLTVLSDGGFADKRTEAQAWEEALRSARLKLRLLDLAHEELIRLGQPRGVVGLLNQI